MLGDRQIGEAPEVFFIGVAFSEDQDPVMHVSGPGA